MCSKLGTRFEGKAHVSADSAQLASQKHRAGWPGRVSIACSKLGSRFEGKAHVSADSAQQASKSIAQVVLARVSCGRCGPTLLVPTLIVMQYLICDLLVV